MLIIDIMWCIMVIELTENPMCDFKIERAHSASLIWNHKYDFRPKFAQHKVQLPLYYIHFEIAPVQDLVSSNILLMQYWASLKLNSSIFVGEKTRVLETKVAKFTTWYSLSFIFLQLDWLLNTSLEILLVILYSV